jgi:hypothetical protein
MPPDKIYKYRSLVGDAFKYTQAIFSRGQIYLANVNQFNDLFEGKFRLGSGISKNDDMYAKVIKGLFATGASWLMSGRVSDKARLSCFSESRDDVLMWSHYAASHTGICIEFDTTAANSPFRECKKVEYSPSFNVINDNTEEIFQRACLVKAEQWQYEHEWRLIRKSEEFVTFPRECLTGVIFGCRISNDDRQWVRDWLQGYSHASIYQAIEVKHDIRLSIEPIE